MGRLSKIIRVTLKLAPVVYPIAKKMLNNRKLNKSKNQNTNNKDKKRNP